MYRHSGFKGRQSWHVQDMIQKQGAVDPVTAVSTAPAAQLINEIDTSVAALAEMCGRMNNLMSQTRAGNVAAQPTLMLQQSVEDLRRKVISLQGDVAMIRESHASIVQMQPLVPQDSGMGMENDPMAASMQQQPPMNMPPGGQDAGMNGMGM